MSLAKAVITGTVYRAPEKRFTTNNIPISAFAMNISENEETLVRVVTKGKLAEAIGDNLAKGDRVIVEGRIQNNTVKNEDGTEKRIVEIDAFVVETISGSGASVSGSSSASSSQSSSSSLSNSKNDSIVQFGEQPEFADELIGEDEIPF